MPSGYAMFPWDASPWLCFGVDHGEEKFTSYEALKLATQIFHSIYEQQVPVHYKDGYKFVFWSDRKKQVLFYCYIYIFIF